MFLLDYYVCIYYFVLNLAYACVTYNKTLSCMLFANRGVMSTSRDVLLT